MKPMLAAEGSVNRSLATAGKKAETGSQLVSVQKERKEKQTTQVICIMLC